MFIQYVTMEIEMLEKVVNEFRSRVPAGVGVQAEVYRRQVEELVKLVKSNSSELVERAKREGSDAYGTASTQAKQVRGEAYVGLWNLETKGLEVVSDLIANAPDAVSGNRAAAKLSEALGVRLQKVTEAPFADYDTMNAKNVIANVRKLDHLGLARLERSELSGKSRKTVLDAVEARRNALS
jgi:hypothetical protein